MSENHFLERKECPACKSLKLEQIYSCGFQQSPIREYLEAFYSGQGHIESKYLADASYILVECSDCGMIFQREIPDDFLSDKLYEEWIDPDLARKRHLEDYNLQKFKRYAQEILLLIGYVGKSLNELKFFDFGMGWGEWANVVRAFGCSCTGLEISPTRIEFARSQGLKIISPDKVPEGHYDVINCEQVFEHIADPLGTLRWLKTALKPGGLIKVNVPDGRGVKRYLSEDNWRSAGSGRKLINPVSPLEHINCYNRSGLIRMGEVCGLKSIDIPLSLQWKYSINIDGIGGILKGLLRPIYGRYWGRSTNVLFRFE
ncbi:hypothetical protein CEE37_01170 [candidate division LCP-89 bacterium B3_LCP]|uniref:Methyltransferase n=1 Tax=candidate division LCP-89 bacterium B3_LCP TaxID=2012998 RepID=A0A532V554_UNCL8|nr:MAG: hypothetical protein CEE37_01170 [candidate division LCP-89 bacterium B3_LCP]